MSKEGSAAPAAAARVRGAQREATRLRLLDAAVAALIEVGVARTTTLEVQRRAGVSRGALLHHFPTHAELLSATVARLVEMNERAIREEAAAAAHIADPLSRGIRTLVSAFAHPSLVAELELWAVARTDEGLRTALRRAEKPARAESDRVMAELFAPLGDRPGLGRVVALSVEFARGLAITSILRRDDRLRDQMVESWIEAAREMLDNRPAD
ncbi:TetR/AcrR family transcriptional regulator [Marinibaculum pumilum]|uniref:TetR/AcrR family transcriptional regulator n=1 Tax=Marinibaculum pumilum TaxID=1766165 RepID=A0ABV7L0U7_9PROT